MIFFVLRIVFCDRYSAHITSTWLPRIYSIQVPFSLTLDQITRSLLMWNRNRKVSCHFPLICFNGWPKNFFFTSILYPRPQEIAFTFFLWIALVICLLTHSYVFPLPHIHSCMHHRYLWLYNHLTSLIPPHLQYSRLTLYYNLGDRWVIRAHLLRQPVFTVPHLKKLHITSPLCNFECIRQEEVDRWEIWVAHC